MAQNFVGSNNVSFLFPSGGYVGGEGGALSRHFLCVFFSNKGVSL